ncbi:MAG: penicillin-insensitive murein endopeptidase [Symbiopectobacterium sp.]
MRTGCICTWGYAVQADSLECQDQDAPPADDGCGAELSSWFTRRQPSPEAPVKTLPPLPASCQA